MSTRPTEIFVFGSNLGGIHGKGAARTARDSYGAVSGVGRGRTGNAYAIPTKRTPTRDTRQLPLEEIQQYIQEFMDYARAHPELTFLITKVGCGLAGYTEKEIAPMFEGMPPNCELLRPWRD